jgi:hypothetical protein
MEDKEFQGSAKVTISFDFQRIGAEDEKTLTERLNYLLGRLVFLDRYSVEELIVNKAGALQITSFEEM